VSDEDEDLVIAQEPQAPEPGRLATLGEILEAHHRRFVEKVRRRRQEEEQDE
jgi:hypothetical protein